MTDQRLYHRQTISAALPNGETVSPAAPAARMPTDADVSSPLDYDLETLADVVIAHETATPAVAVALAKCLKRFLKERNLARRLLAQAEQRRDAFNAGWNEEMRLRGENLLRIDELESELAELTARGTSADDF